MKNFKEFTIKSKPFISEIISGVLWDFEIDGIYEEEDSLKVIANENSDIDEVKIEEVLQRLVNEKLIESFDVKSSILGDKNWNEEWESSLNVIEISDKIAICPSFREFDPKDGQVAITIDPKMSFGTGEHESTRLVLQFIPDYVNEGMKVLDLGSGTGVLAIAAIKFGAASALAIDSNEWCFVNGQENVKLNNVSDKVAVRMGEINEINDKDYDLILANIQRNVLLEIAEDIKDHLKDNGLVILSGLMEVDKELIIEKYKSLNFELVDKKILGEWISFVFRK